MAKKTQIKWTLKAGTSWRAKLEKDQPPKVVKIPPKMQKRFGTGTMLVPRPLDVDALIRKIPKGKLATTSQIGDRLAKDCKADCACPMTTGILSRLPPRPPRRTCATARNVSLLIGGSSNPMAN